MRQCLLFFMMKAFTHISAGVEQALSSLHASTHDPITYSGQALPLLLNALHELDRSTEKEGFASEREEVAHFKFDRPQLLAKLIYYNTLYHFETAVGSGRRHRRRLASKELRGMEAFRRKHLDFYRYYRSGGTQHDSHYFVRNRQDIKLITDPYLLSLDMRHSTTYDYIAGRLLAQDMLEIYFEQVLAKGEEAPAGRRPNVRWTGRKMALIELLYALHAAGVFDDGNCEIKQLADAFENAFQVNLGQYHRLFIDLRARKADRTRFLRELAERLELRMDAADEGSTRKPGYK